MKKNRNKKNLAETHSFRTFFGAESYVRELLYMKVDDPNKNVINSVAADFIDKLVISDYADVYDHNIYLQDKKIEDVKNRIKYINSELNRLKNELDESETYLAEIENEKTEYISYKREYEKKSIYSAIMEVLLLYIKDIDKFNDSTVQEVFISYENIYNQNLIIKFINNYLDVNMNKQITVIDINSDEKTEYSLELKYSTVKSIKKVINEMKINKQ